jgi:hypothetical protein
MMQKRTKKPDRKPGFSVSEDDPYVFLIFFFAFLAIRTSRLSGMDRPRSRGRELYGRFLPLLLSGSLALSEAMPRRSAIVGARMTKYIIAAAVIVLVGSVMFGFSVKVAVLALVVMFVAAVAAILKRK